MTLIGQTSVCPTADKKKDFEKNIQRFVSKMVSTKGFVGKKILLPKTKQIWFTKLDKLILTTTAKSFFYLFFLAETTFYNFFLV